MAAAVSILVRISDIDPIAAKKFIFHAGYWIVFVSSALYFWLLLKYIWPKISRLISAKYRWGLLGAMIGAVFLQIHEPRQFKIMYDEYSITGVARNMHFLREASFPTTAHYISDRLYVTESQIDKRPFFFPFVLSLLHDLTGYRVGNAFILNALASLLLLLLVYVFGVKEGGVGLGLALQSLFLSLPLLAQCTTSGGYDVFNLCMIGMLWYTGIQYLSQSGAGGLNLFVLTSIHLAQTRYESILYTLVVIALVGYKWWRERVPSLTWLSVVCPLFLALPLLINKILMAIPGSLETKPGQDYFGFYYFPDNAKRALLYLFTLDFDSSNSFILSLFGSIALVFLIVAVFVRRRTFFASEKDTLLFALITIMIATSILTLCNFWGQWDDPVASRFSLPLCLAFILIIGRVVGELWRSRPVPYWLPALSFSLALAFSVPAAVRSFATHELISAQENAWFENVLSTRSKQRVLAIADSSIGLILYGYPAVSTGKARTVKWKLNECLKNRTYDEIIVLERFLSGTAKVAEVPFDGRALGSDFVREAIAEVRFRANTITRASRILRVEGIDSLPPDEYVKEDFAPNDERYIAHLYKALP
ncbi:MAG: hypothetical protein IPP19_06495 [Verrucomicrobia bacterium]|nr:hypothetical protein [Verrucomicrobiota bacterium]